MTLLSTVIDRLLGVAVPLGLVALAFLPGTIFVGVAGLLWLAGRSS